MNTRAPRVGSIRILYKLAIMDLDSRVMPHKGHQVEVTQPFGCPKNGTMGHCYVNCLTCGNVEGKTWFLGLVCLGSLYAPNEAVEVLEEWTHGDFAGTKKCRVRTADGGERVTASTNVPDYLIADWRANH